MHIFSFNGNHFNTLNPITTNVYEVQDIKLNKTNGKLMICGVGFITIIDAPISCINSPSGMTVSTTISDSCFGRACVSVSGGIPPYSYLWSNGSTDSCIIGVPAGTYSVIVSDNSCSFNNFFKDTIVMNPAIQLSVSPVNPKICLGDTATFIATSSGIGTTFQWSNGSTGNSISVSPPISTTYTVTANNNFCSDTIPVHVIVNNPHTFSNQTICYGSNFNIGTHNYSNSGIYTDTLSSYLGCDSIVTTQLTVLPLNQNIINPIICNGSYFQVGNNIYNISGTYIDTLQTSIGCDSIIKTNLTVNNEITATINPVICKGDFFQIGFNYYSEAGTYIDHLVSSNGCDSIVTTNLSFYPTPDINLGNDTIICLGKNVVLNASYPNTTYLWSDNSTNPTFNVTKEGWYKVKVTLNGCCFSDSIFVKTLICPPLLELPNIITPNNDGNNDKFLPILTENIEKMNTQIFNRWGNLIYETDNLQIEWDGKYNGIFVADGVYFWIINYRDTQGKESMMKGTVSVLK